MNPGEVYQVEFPPRGGHEQAGSRPAIIMQGEQVSAQLPTVLCIPFTTQLDVLRFPGTVLVQSEADSGLSRASVALVFQLTAIDKRRIKALRGQLSSQSMAAIRKALDDLTERGIIVP